MAKDQKWIKFTRGSFATDEDWKTVCEECDADPETTESITFYYNTAVVIDTLERGN